MIEQQTVTVDTPTDEHDITHVHCCRDTSAILCGLDGTDFERADGGSDCVECAREDDAGRCPLYRRCLTDELTCN